MPSDSSHVLNNSPLFRGGCDKRAAKVGLANQRACR